MIREAAIPDAGAVASVHVRSWQGAYVGLVPQNYLDSLRVERRRTMWERILAQTSWPRSGTLLAEADGTVIGFVHVSPTRDEDRDPATVGEVTSIYVVPEMWGTGNGRALMAAGLDRLGRAGFEQATLWVLDDNVRARRFYEAGLWRPDGAIKQDDSRGFPITEVRYVRDLQTRPGTPGSVASG